MRNIIKNGIALLVSISIAVGLLLAVNFLIGRFMADVIHDPYPRGYLLKPGTAVRYQTSEFDITANINSHGLRGAEFDPDREDSFRILCVGDSWTFGWGAEDEEAWPAVLEADLRSEGYPNVEVINAGKVGASTFAAIEDLKNYIPQYKPDLVIFGLLQLDDLAQLYEHKELLNEDSRFDFSDAVPVTLIEKMFGNILKLPILRPRVIQVKPFWRKQMQSLLRQFNDEELKSFDRLPENVKSMYLAGELNPGLAFYDIHFTGRNRIFNDPQHPSTIAAVKEAQHYLELGQEFSRMNGIPFLFVTFPMHYSTGHHVTRTAEINKGHELMVNNRIDPLYRSLIESRGFAYFELTEHFKALPNKTDYYFAYDGHLTPAGYAEVADQIGQHILKEGWLE